MHVCMHVCVSLYVWELLEISNDGTTRNVKSISRVLIRTISRKNILLSPLYCIFLHSEKVIERKTLSFIYPLLYPLYNQQSLSGLTHGVTVNHISHHYYAMESFHHHIRDKCLIITTLVWWSHSIFKFNFIISRSVPSAFEILTVNLSLHVH